MDRASHHDQALHKASGQLLAQWQEFPAEAHAQLLRELGAAIDSAAQAEPELITVMNPTSRPRRLRLAVLCSDDSLDPFYQGEWSEFAVSDDGVCYLIYRRRDGGDYAVEWTPATQLSDGMNAQLSDALVLAVMGSTD